MNEIFGKTLKESLVRAKARYQPYINLVNNIYSFDELFSSDSFKSYKELELKSLYFRADKLILDEEFSHLVAKLELAGIREIFIFCSQEESRLSTEKLNEFIKLNGIRVNFQIAQITKDDLEAINLDSIGRNDILGFDKIKAHQITYKDGYVVDLLNDKDTDETILANYKKKNSLVLEESNFELEEPKYVSFDDDQNPIKIEKGKENIGLEVELQLELDKNVEIEENIEEESELDLDKEQEDNKFTLEEARDRCYQLSKSFFYEENILTNHYIYEDSARAVQEIFNSNDKIKFITSKALDIIAKNYYIFEYGIETDNMPIGLAIKNGIIFATDQRTASMKVNDFTLKTNQLKPVISNPLKYSWLKYASKASISLNDIYGTEIAPRIFGEDEHPQAKETNKLNQPFDTMLDIPYNQYHSSYTINEVSKTPIHHSIVNMINYSHKMFGIKFHNLSDADIKYLNIIEAKLIERGMLDEFVKIINEKEFKDGGFLLQENASIFLEKLFQEILPLNKNDNKINFFKSILRDHKFANNNNLEDVFEGLDGFYKKLEEFIITEEISDVERIFSLAIKIIKNQIKNCYSFKIVMSRFIKILELITSNGGNLLEQMEHLSASDVDTLLRNPKQYLTANDLGVNIVHKSAKLSNEIDNKYGDNQLALKNLIKIILY